MHKKKVPTIFITILFKRYFISKKVYLQFLIKKIVQTRSIKKKKTSSPILEHFIQINYAPLTPPTRPYFPKTNNHRFTSPSRS